jgi:DNA-directed RNA polymerase subunit N (RpoN/RPB10)
MTTSFEGRHCVVCGNHLTHRYFSLSKRLQKAHQSSNGISVEVLDDSLLADFCCRSCCDEVESTIASTLKVAY